MEDSTLGRIISVEKEIQERLDLERAKAFEWLENQRTLYERKFLEEEDKIKNEFERELEQAITEAELSASAFVDDARAAGTSLDNLDERSIAQIVARYIGRVIPGSMP